MRNRRRLILVAAAIVFAIALVLYLVQSVTQPTIVGFTFTAAGDYSSGSDTSETLKEIAASGAAFNLALGDLSYGKLASESAWCDYVKQTVGDTFPFEIIAGNHESEDNGTPSQSIAAFTRCLPDRLGSVGDYGRQYYFDFPRGEPFARLIMISPGLVLDGVRYSYDAGSERYNWVRSAIEGARRDGISWVIVGAHYPCLSMVTNLCEMGADLFRLLLDERVDLVIVAHDHTYQRTRQLVQGNECPQVEIGAFDERCAPDPPSTASYQKGAGTIQMTIGSGGVSLYNINPSDSEAGYFATSAGQNTDGPYGLGKFTVTRSKLRAVFVGTAGGPFSDDFSIG